MVASQVAEEVIYPDGRVGLASTDEIAGSGYANGDLAIATSQLRCSRSATAGMSGMPVTAADSVTAAGRAC